MKQIIPIIVASLFSAFAAVMIYKHYEVPQQVIIRESIPVNLASEKAKVAYDYESATTAVIVPPGSPNSFAHSASISKPAVVFIESRMSSNNFWGKESYGSSTGSGVIISKDGYIATNNHVIENGKEIMVTLNDQREYEAKVVGQDPSTDLALLKIEGPGFNFVEFGDSDSILVGDWVLAVGSPFRLQSTVTAGIVSAKSRNINILQDQAGIESFIQTDAAVNPGNSGGALVNTSGKLIGINTAIITYSGQYEGFSFAVPSNLARKVLTDLREFGTVKRGWLGVEIEPITDALAKKIGLNSVKGILIQKVNENGSASRAGLRSQDVLISVNGIETSSTPSFMEAVGQFRPGDKIEIGFVRKGKKLTVDVVLGERPNALMVSSNEVELNTKQNEIFEELGFSLRNLTGDEKSKLDTEGGVVVTQIFRGSKIARTNMEENYIITEINGKGIQTKDQLIKEIAGLNGMIVLKGFYEKYPGEYPYAFHKE